MTLGTWRGVIDPLYPQRTVKPRQTGMTMVIDKGLGLRETEDLLQVGSEWIDWLKLSFGTSCFYPEQVLKDKIALTKEYDVGIYPGGTLLEVAFLQGRFLPFLDHSLSLGFTAIEISDGTIDLQTDLRYQAIEAAKERGFTVLTEVGKKSPENRAEAVVLRKHVQEDIKHGADWVIVEGRESGKGVGIYDPQGKVIWEDLQALTVGNVLDRMIWEAPLKGQQEAMITTFGPNVNLGNIPTSDLLAVEALRTGMRGDTLKFYLQTRNGH